MEDTTIENALKTFQDLYLKKEYPLALTELEKNAKIVEPGLWHYNMGTVLAEMNEWPLARFHFIMAEKSGLESQQLHRNQQLAESKLEIGRLEKPLTTSDFFIKAAMVSAEGPLLSLSLVFLVIGLMALKKSRTIKAALIFSVAVLSPLILNFWIHSWTPKIVTTAKSIYDGPSALFQIKGELPAGVMILTNTKGNWDEIIFPSRFSGWVKLDSLKSLEPK